MKRWLRLCVLCSIPFSCHYEKTALSVLGEYILCLKCSFEVNAFQFGILSGIHSLPSIFIPLICGHFSDSEGSLGHLIVLFLMLVLLGQVIFTISIALDSWNLSIFSQLMLGCGTSAVVVLQRVMVAKEFSDRRVLSTGCIIASTHLAKITAKLTTAPLIEASSCVISAGFTAALCLVILLSAFRIDAGAQEGLKDASKLAQSENSGSLVCQHLVDEECTYQRINYERPAIECSTDERCSEMQITESAPNSFQKIWRSVRALSPLFWLLVAIHGSYAIIFHLFDNFLPHLISVKWHQTHMNSAFISSLLSVMVILFAPVTGYVIDRGGLNFRRVSFNAAAAVTTIAYVVIVFGDLQPYLPILLLSTGQALIPMVSQAAMIAELDPNSYGTAFGAVGCIDAISSFVANMVFGLAFHVTGSYDVGLSGLFVFSLAAGFAVVGYECCHSHLRLPEEVDDIEAVGTVIDD